MTDEQMIGWVILGAIGVVGWIMLWVYLISEEKINPLVGISILCSPATIFALYLLI